MKSKIILGGLLLSTTAFVSLQSPQITSAESLTNSAEIIVPLNLKVKAHYTNGLPLEAGKEVRLRNLTDGSTEVLKKQVDANGEVTFTEQDGIKKEVNYGIETDGVRNGYTVRYDLGGEKEKDITVNLPGSELPLSLKVKAHYTNGLPLEAGKEVRLRNLTDGSTEVLKKQVDANGEVTFTEQDGIKKEVNYGIETDGVRNGYTVRYDLGGEKEKDIAVKLPGVTKNTNSKQSSDSKASFNHPSTFFNNNKRSSNLNYNNSNKKRELMNQEKNKEGNRNKNTMELPKTGEKYNGLPVYVGLFTAIASIIGLKKNKF